MKIIKKTFLVGVTENGETPQVISRRFYGHISEKTAVQWARSHGLKKLLLTHAHADRDDLKKGVWDVREAILNID